MWRLDGLETPYMSEFASCWALLAGSLLIALPLILWRIKDHVTIEEDLTFSDQTYAEVEGKLAEGEEEVTHHTLENEGKV